MVPVTEQFRRKQKYGAQSQQPDHGGYPFRGSRKPCGYVASPVQGQYGATPSAESDAAYYGGAAIGFGTAVAQSWQCIRSVVQAGLEAARGQVAAI